MRSDQRRRDQYKGRNSSKPLWRSVSETIFSHRDLTLIANQERFEVDKRAPYFESKLLLCAMLETYLAYNKSSFHGLKHF